MAAARIGLGNAAIGSPQLSTARRDIDVLTVRRSERASPRARRLRHVHGLRRWASVPYKPSWPGT